ncbi:calcium-binding protein [Leptolyngbya sp. KIOST-1]|uniref:calcium-binding protein n=1 Tax=Leptolyngbya sp. KIOST-1 TaxID=1229172 RepID=UPI000A98B8BD|nr:type I secretion C-terminal target domain-containing protein [Leptolyngbya sp. KIOST-1]
MPDLFVPPSKTPPAPESEFLAAPAEAGDDETILSIPTSAATPMDLDVELNLLAADAPAPAALAEGDTIPTVDTVFFYGRTATGTTLYQVDLESGQLAPIADPGTLFTTAIEGLFTAAPGGLGGDGEASTEPPRTFTVIEGTSGKNFLIGTTADNALFGFGSDDLILTGRGTNLAFGGTGNDTLVAGPGGNALFGGEGDDAIEGGEGDDVLVGGAGNDILYGGAGANLLIGGTGADIFRLNTPGAYSPLVDPAALTAEPDTIFDFNPAEGDLLDFSLIAAQPLFDGRDLLPFLSFVQVGADTHVQVTTPLGQTVTEAILLNVDADTLTPDSLTFTPPPGVPLLK